MKHCPNIDCAHRRAVGSPAEYIADVTVCVDCGATLIDGAAPEPATTEAPVASPLMRRLAITLLAVPMLLVPAQIALPGIDTAALSSELRALPFSFGLGLPKTMSVIALGLSPLVSAAVLVGLATLVVPRWRRLDQHAHGRRALRRATLGITLLGAVVQAYGIARLLEGLPAVYTGSLPITVLTLTAGTMSLLAGAELLSRHGLGNGLSVLIGLDLLLTIVERMITRFASPDSAPITPGPLALQLGAPILGTYAIARLLDARRPAEIRGADEGPSAYRVLEGAARVAPRPFLRLPSSGVAPLIAGASLFTLAGAEALRTLGLDDLSLALRAGVAPVAVHGALTIAIALALAFALHPAPRLARLASRLAPDAEPDPRAVTIARAEVRRAAIRSAALLGAIAVLTHVASPWLPSFPGAAMIFVLAAVGLDLHTEWRARAAGGELVTVAALDDVDAAEAAIASLEDARIAAHARGRAHRTLLQIFGSYVPVEIMVAPDHADEARAILKPFDIGDADDAPRDQRAPKRRKRRKARPAAGEAAVTPSEP